MKSKRVAAVLALVMTPSLHAQSLPSELAQLGIVAGMPYAKAKRLMDAAGWQAGPVQDAPESLEGFPEVGCQKGGRQCATTFRKDGQEVAVRLGTTLAGQPFVQGAD
ncbi:hypothetical protein ABFC53_10285 [Stenotrophomonas pavanii]|jgi:hypothetical protein|uniref:Uncharacterized protein n=1 Tax=Stenotrophomonas pavanii TaxID=487698 RepID=A0A246L1W2_9GAMM|nr:MULTISPECIES: hypothetical protein [Stenotrophomonas]MBC9079338.1 hypothetical protein [Stenotrophomonas maltophilia]TGR45180.1 hypothetical protein EN842_28195 [bacterium M00.F.Ca.ET.199.01.1.1]TGT03958.1 hypothetical protein EN820_19705 [bacterium M00.F.Ca.ET.177.01.1.1]TGT58476.1 hypothetical protein EN813_034685 [Mesorhizobium sp. M00.F.Ca.ET.170.01.1.1]TGU08404.1 hypothetical protein EN806_30790 [bacterium M00.F.Ca.ET.163.01.1.1]TGU92459.1 hypothetical protein EN794_037085 [Mesorhizob